MKELNLKKMKKIMIISTLMLAGVLQGQFLAQEAFSERKEIVEQRVEAQMVAFITHRLELSPEESTRFWPVYNEYREKQRAIRRDALTDRRLDNLTDEEANKLINQQIVMEEKLLSLKREYIAKLRDTIPPRKLARLHGAEQAFKVEILQRLRNRVGRDNRK